MTRFETPPFAQTDAAADAVVLDGVAQRLGGKWALRGVTLSVAVGELVAVVGHNGSGKTTLLRVVATALRPTRGRGSVYGHDLLREPGSIRALAAMLANGGGLYADLSAAENLTFAQRMTDGREDRAAVAEALRRVGLGHVADVRVRAFSSGMQRRLALARLHLRRTPLLLLDEPYNSLDAEGAAMADELLDDVRARGGTAVVVLHDLGRSGIEFDRVVELADGRVVRAQRRAARRAPRGLTIGVG